MIVRRKDMRIQVRPEMKGGKGEVTVLHMVECDGLDNIRFVGEMTVPPNGSIGDHAHEGETEYYLISEGIGIVLDGGKDHRVTRGDVIVTGGGGSHRIRNAGSTELKITAFIVTH